MMLDHSFWKLEDVGELVHEASLLSGLLLQVQIHIIQVAGAKQFQQFTSAKTENKILLLLHFPQYLQHR